jgi:hypothetical protein
MYFTLPLLHSSCVPYVLPTPGGPERIVCRVASTFFFLNPRAPLMKSLLFSSTNLPASTNKFNSFDLNFIILLLVWFI